MLLLEIPWWVVFLVPSKLWILYYLIGVAAVTSVSAWIIGVRMRRKIRDDLGKDADASDLTSVETWMKVDEVGEKEHPGRAWAPQDFDPGPDGGGLTDFLLPENKRK